MLLSTSWPASLTLQWKDGIPEISSVDVWMLRPAHPIGPYSVEGGRPRTLLIQGLSLNLELSSYTDLAGSSHRDLHASTSWHWSYALTMLDHSGVFVQCWDLNSGSHACTEKGSAH